MASLVLGSIGSTLGGPIGGFIGSTVGSLIDSALLTPDPPDVKGPGIDDTDSSAADPGTPIPLTFGADRVGGVVIHATPIQENRNEEEVSSGKKSYSFTTYTYSMTVDIMVGEGPIIGIGRIWADGKLIRGQRSDFSPDSIENKFKVGAFPYPSWYFERIEEPNNLPWGFAPESPTRYMMDYDTGEMYVVGANTARQKSAEGHVIYWYSYEYETYIPVDTSIDYRKPMAVEPEFMIYDDKRTTGEYYDDIELASWSQTGYPPYCSLYIAEDGDKDNIIDYSYNNYYKFGAVVSVDIPGDTVVGRTNVECGGSTYFPNASAYKLEDRTHAKVKSGSDLGGSLDETAVAAAVGVTTIFADHTPGETMFGPNGFSDTTVVSGMLGSVSNTANGYSVDEDYAGWVTHSMYINHSIDLTDKNSWNLKETNVSGSPSLADTDAPVEQFLSWIDAGEMCVSVYFFLTAEDQRLTDVCRAYFEVYARDGFNSAWKSLLFQQTAIYGESGHSFRFAIMKMPPGTRHLRFKAYTYSLPHGNPGEGVGPWCGMEIEGSWYRWEPIRPIQKDWIHYYNLHSALNDWSPNAVLQFDNPDDLEFYKGAWDQPSDAIMSEVVGEDVPGYRGRAHIVFDNLQLEDFGNRLPNFTFEVVRYENEQVTTVIAELMERAGLDGTYYELSELPVNTVPATRPENLPAWSESVYVPGYTIGTRTSITKALETLLEAFNIDVAEVQYALQFRFRHREPDHAIPFDRLAAHDADKTETDVPIKLSSKDTLSLPRTVEAVFSDLERSYQFNSKHYTRTQTENDHLSSVELAMVLYPWFTAAWTQRKVQDLWNGQISVEFSIPQEYIYVSPTDILSIQADTQTFNVKVTDIRRGVNGTIDCSGVLWLGGLYPADNYDDFAYENNYVEWSHYYEVGNTALHMLDLPPLNSSEPDWGVYYALADERIDTWRGAALMYSTDSNNYTLIDNATVGSAVGSIVYGELESGYAQCTVDSESEFTIELSSYAAPTPVSHTVDDMMSLQYLLYVNGEVISYSNVEYLGEKQYRLSAPFIRGLRNTSALAAVAGDDVVFLDVSSLLDWTDGSYDHRNEALMYKAISKYATEAATNAVSETFIGYRAIPFPPVMVTGERDGSNNLTITWVRQDRKHIAWPDSSDLPNSEVIEEYEIEIVNPQDYSILRTETVEDATEYVYSAANQVSDGITAGVAVIVRIYQMSSVVGRGLPAQEIV